MTIEIHNESSSDIDETKFQGLTRHVLKSLHVHPETEVSIIFVTEENMQRLHEQWMGEEGATDVLSFPMDELRPGRFDAQTPAGLLGDIVICPDVAKLQALAAGHSDEAEMLILLTHGLLHLLGFDHATPFEEAEMFGLQRELIESFNAAEKNT